ncbi:MAG: glycosyltransferase family 39 protein [Bacteroidota bacterium]
MIKQLGRLYQKWWFWPLVCVGLALPAYLINLGLQTLLADEPIRALVALEMILQKNYWVSTTFGEYYYNKPPLYPWILAVLFQLTGDYSEWMIRLPSVVPLFGFCLTIYWAVKRYLNQPTAILSAFIGLTYGRMLIYSSFLGHIDILYSWLTFVGFLWLYEQFNKQNWLALFIGTYLVTAAGFMMKGLPSLVFQGLTLLAWFSYQREFRRLFSWQHVAGGLLLLGIVGGYFWKYSQYNDLESYFLRLWTESSSRTVAEKSWLESISHIVAFPFDQWIHLAPWSLLVVYVYSKRVRRLIWEQPFLKFGLIVLAANTWIYWLSPDTRPRYLFMLYPFIGMVLGYTYLEGKEKLPILNKWVEGLLGVVAGAMIFVLPIAPFIEYVRDEPLIWVKTGVLLLGFLLCIWAYIKTVEKRMLIFTAMLLLMRIGFDWFVIPHRYQTSPRTEAKMVTEEINRITWEAPLYFDMCAPYNEEVGYYLTLGRKQVVHRDSEDHDGAFYIYRDNTPVSLPHQVYFRFTTRFQNTRLKVIKFADKY